MVVSDFETWSYLYGTLHGLPVVSLDNNQVVNRCAFPDEVLAGKEAEYLTAKAIVKAKLPGCFHYLITSFFRPEITHPRTTLHPPVLRPEIRAARPEPGEHLLVYQTSTSNDGAPRDPGQAAAGSAASTACGATWRRRCARATLRYRPFSEPAFIEDLRTARAVVSGGSFTLMSEAVHLGPPHALGAGEEAVRADPQRPLPAAARLRTHRRGGDRRAGWASCWSGPASSSGTSPPRPHPGHEETLASLEAVLAPGRRPRGRRPRTPAREGSPAGGGARPLRFHIKVFS